MSSILYDAARITDWQTVLNLCSTSPHLACYSGHDRWTPLHHACDRRPPSNVVKALLCAHPDALLEQDKKGWTPLHHACRFKASSEVIRLLLYLFSSRGNLAAARRDHRGRTALYYALRYDSPEDVAEMLLDVNPNAVLEQDRAGESPLTLVWNSYAMSSSGKRDIHKCLSAKEPFSSCNERIELEARSQLKTKWEKVNSFLYAAFQQPKTSWRILHALSSIECHYTLFLLAKSLHPQEIKEIDEITGQAALHRAASSPASGDLAHNVIGSLVAAFPGAAQIADSVNGSLPLHLAAANERKRSWRHDGVETIYSAYPEAIKARDGQGRLPLHLAAATISSSKSFSSSCKSLRAKSRTDNKSDSVIQNLINCYPEAACIADGEGKLPLHFIAQHGEDWNDDAEAMLNTNRCALRTRIYNRDDATHGCLPIHMAAMNLDSKPSLVENLLAHHPRGALQADGLGRLPLHLASESGKAWESGSKIIYSAYPSAVNEKDEILNWTPLHYAAANKKTGANLIITLLELSANEASLPDANGRYPLHLACASGKSWDNGLRKLFHAYPDAIGMEDSRGALPFHSAILSGKSLDDEGERMDDDLCKVNTIFELLLLDISVLNCCQ